MRILDLATGYGFFAFELAEQNNSLKIVGIDISQNDIRQARKNLEGHDLADQVAFIAMDATSMGFPSGSFDMIVNFLGLEDIHMTRGRNGVQNTFIDASRVLKPRGYFCFAAMPTDEMETEAQKIEVALFSYISNATWLTTEEYESMLSRAGLKSATKRSYYTGKKFTREHAKIEIRFACDNVPSIYGISTPSFEDVWAKFGKRIEQHGLGHYSKVVLFIAEKTGKARGPKEVMPVEARTPS